MKPTIGTIGTIKSKPPFSSWSGKKCKITKITNIDGKGFFRYDFEILGKAYTNSYFFSNEIDCFEWYNNLKTVLPLP